MRVVDGIVLVMRREGHLGQPREFLFGPGKKMVGNFETPALQPFEDPVSARHALPQALAYEGCTYERLAHVHLDIAENESELHAFAESGAYVCIMVDVPGPCARFFGAPIQGQYNSTTIPFSLPMTENGWLPFPTLRQAQSCYEELLRQGGGIGRRPSVLIAQFSLTRL